MIILIVVFIIHLRSVEEFIENQVYSSSQDTLYSLALSLSKVDPKKDKGDVKLIIQAIFDSGYYAYIKYEDMNNKVIYEASLPIVIKDVPQWFVSLIPVQLHAVESDVNDGWIRRGKLYLKAHPGYAYYELYNSFKELLFTFLIIFVIAFIVLLVIVNILLYSLNKITRQADGIGQHKFIIEKENSFITEFHLLIESMNKMVHKVEDIFRSEVKTFEEYQNLLYKDEESGLPNKRYFMLQLKEMLEDENKSVGYLALISISGLDTIKQEQGYEAYIKALEGFVKTIMDNNKHYLLARISEAEIAILFDTHDVELIEQYFHNLQTKLDVSSREIASKERLFCFSIGVAPCYDNDKISEVLSRVDYSLSRSKINGCNIIDLYDTKDAKNRLVVSGKSSWKKMFDKIFQEHRVALALQRAEFAENHRIYHEEALIRIKEEDGSIATAAYYLPMAHTLGIISKFDYIVIERILGEVESFENPMALNISKEFVLQSIYFLELRNRLSALRKKVPQRLHFESSENDILQNLDAYVEFADMIHAHKQKFGIDRFGGMENLSYIERLRPDYIKISANFILEALEENKALLNALEILSKTMGIELIITALQSADDLEKLQASGYEIFQGQYIAQPRLIG
jgi:EAL domain-containing protein (putative c-di-GMP-specific phosphodiesterase class I)/GGDEF domain-containing protein